ncbi:hypothetical protein HYH02_011955 [Chlamydomonas schloesseri]|uniref:Kazal-like domain-containing protein n=1 Tax=Chlamydomonas schloesseri TaxID=2026947 RepID=A0A835TCI0_9CHLO|nr:hypothetical protein HYH02_011955 [Chlamydomonas schloesseri]|eukprot:KAG2435455.1 hypothetical protein HYH02_011955 [Chlamydomonas schloesseri]
MARRSFANAGLLLAIFAAYGLATALAQDTCICPYLYDPVCDIKTGKTYSNACFAKCAGVDAVKAGACSLDSSRRNDIFPACPGNLPVVRCMQPCSKPCAADPSAICVANPCGVLLTYRGYKIGACGEVWVNTKGDVVDACMVDITTSCDGGAPRVMCSLTSPTCATATCPGAPASAKCIVKNCQLTYQGQTLSPCTPIFYNKVSGEVYDCTAPLPRRLLQKQ